MVSPFFLQEPPFWTALTGHFTAAAIGWGRKEGPVATLTAFVAQWLLWCVTQGLQILQGRRQKECKSQRVGCSAVKKYLLYITWYCAHKLNAAMVTRVRAAQGQPVNSPVNR